MIVCGEWERGSGLGGLPISGWSNYVNNVAVNQHRKHRKEEWVWRERNIRSALNMLYFDMMSKTFKWI